MTIRRLLTLTLALSIAVAGACSDDSKVGSDELRNFESQDGEGALGGTTTTIAVPVETTAAPAAAAPTTTAKATQTTKPPVQTTAAPATTAQQSSIVIKIQGDTQGNAFEPSNTRAFANSVVRFHNVDSAAHQVRGRNGEFQSPNLAPNATWDFKLTLAPGVYEYTDTARPYAVGYLEVLAR